MNLQKIYPPFAGATVYHFCTNRDGTPVQFYMRSFQLQHVIPGSDIRDGHIYGARDQNDCWYMYIGLSEVGLMSTGEFGHSSFPSLTTCIEEWMTCRSLRRVAMITTRAITDLERALPVTSEGQQPALRKAIAHLSTIRRAARAADPSPFNETDLLTQFEDWFTLCEGQLDLTREQMLRRLADFLGPTMIALQEQLRTSYSEEAVAALRQQAAAATASATHWQGHRCCSRPCTTSKRHATAQRPAWAR